MIPAKLRDEIDTWMKEGKYGHLQINFAGGKIVNVNRVESIRVDVVITGTGSNTSFTNGTGPAEPGKTNGR